MKYSRITDDSAHFYWEIGECAGNKYYPVSSSERSSNIANTHADQNTCHDASGYNGHFLESEGNLGLYHAQARLYDPEMPRFYGVDAMRVKYPTINPYHYTLNNPVMFTDPTGMYVVQRAYRSEKGVVGTVTRQNISHVQRYEFANGILGWAPIAGSITAAGKIMMHRISQDPSYQASVWDYAAVATLGLSRVPERFPKIASTIEYGFQVASNVNSALNSLVTKEVGRDEVMFNMISQSSFGNGFFNTSNDGHTLTLNEGFANVLAEAGGGTKAVEQLLNGFMGNVSAIVEGIANSQGFDLTSKQGRQDFMNYYDENKDTLDNVLRHLVGGN